MEKNKVPKIFLSNLFIIDCSDSHNNSPIEPLTLQILSKPSAETERIFENHYSNAIKQIRSHG